MFLLLRKKFIDQNGEGNLRVNQDRTVLPPDFYRLFLKLSGKDDHDFKNYGKSIFEFIQPDRKCNDFPVYKNLTCIC